MKKSSISVDRDQFNCPVCLNLLKDPVTSPCGHSFCKACINCAWNGIKRFYSCPQCRATFTSKPDLRKAIMLAEVVEKLKNIELQASPGHCYAGPGEVECDCCIGLKYKAVKSCLVCQASYCEDHLQHHYQSPAFKRHKLVEACTNLQEKICCENDKLMEIYSRTDQSFICSLCTMDQHKGHDTVTAKAERTDKQRHSQAAKSESEGNFTELIKPKQKNKKIRPQAAVQMFLNPKPKSRQAFLQYFCSLTLDPNTAHPRLILSERNRALSLSNTEQSYSDHPERFDYWEQVLSMESLCGRCYWEVEWSGDVFISVSYKDISRKGRGDECLFGNNNQSWSLDCYSSSFSFWHNDTETELRCPASSRIGVYLDHDAGLLSFYSVSDTMKLLHRIHTTFTQPLYAGFGTHYESCLRLM